MEIAPVGREGRLCSNTCVDCRMHCTRLRRRPRLRFSVFAKYWQTRESGLEIQQRNTYGAWLRLCPSLAREITRGQLATERTKLYFVRRPSVFLLHRSQSGTLQKIAQKPQSPCSGVACLTISTPNICLPSLMTSVVMNASDRRNRVTKLTLLR